MITATEILQQLVEKKVVSIIGLAKNVGKTTTLNYLVSLAKRKHILGLTSIGRDGEPYDEIYGHPKPRIYIPTQTIIATAQQSLTNSDITKEILEVTNIATPLGKVIIVRALSDGFVELAGPSSAKELQYLCEQFAKYDVEIILIDGAMNRKSFAAPTITNATILVTGASVAPNIYDMIEETSFYYQILSTPSISKQELQPLFAQVDKFGVITSKGEVLNFPVLTALDLASSTFADIPSDFKYLIVNGVLSNEFLEKLFAQISVDHECAIVVPDSTKIFLNSSNFKLLMKTNWKLRVQKPINLLFVTANPVAPSRYQFDQVDMLSRLREILPIPVIDVVGGG